MMNRRGFLQNLMIGASALAVDPERLLWTPGKKTIFTGAGVGSDNSSIWLVAWGEHYPSVFLMETIAVEEFGRLYPHAIRIASDVL